MLNGQSLHLCWVVHINFQLSPKFESITVPICSVFQVQAWCHSGTKFLQNSLPPTTPLSSVALLMDDVTHTHTHAYAHTHTHTHTHTHIHMYTHTHTHSVIRKQQPKLSQQPMHAKSIYSVYSVCFQNEGDTVGGICLLLECPIVCMKINSKSFGYS